jgi:hypothetical protein
MWWRAGRGTRPEVPVQILLSDTVFQDARRRVILVFRLNIALSLAVSLILIGAITTSIVLGFFGRDVWATALGGVAMLDLVGAALYRPLAQINRALVRAQQIDMLVLSARERLRVVGDIAEANDLATATLHAWADILADLKALSKD